MLTEALLIIAAALAFVLVYVAMLPRVATVTRSVFIRAPAEKIFVLINAPKNWQQWLPWAQPLPGVVVTLAGPESGPNAALTWNGDWQAGAGTITIIEGEPSDFVRVRLDLLRPFPATSFADFLFQPVGDGTRVIWSMTTERSIFARLIATLMRTDDCNGKLFEQALSGLDEAARIEATGSVEGQQ
jgi:hypothetical protein